MKLFLLFLILAPLLVIRAAPPKPAPLQVFVSNQIESENFDAENVVGRVGDTIKNANNMMRQSGVALPDQVTKVLKLLVPPLNIKSVTYLPSDTSFKHVSTYEIKIEFIESDFPGAHILRPKQRRVSLNPVNLDPNLVETIVLFLVTILISPPDITQVIYNFDYIERLVKDAETRYQKLAEHYVKTGKIDVAVLSGNTPENIAANLIALARLNDLIERVIAYNGQIPVQDDTFYVGQDFRDEMVRVAKVVDHVISLGDRTVEIPDNFREILNRLKSLLDRMQSSHHESTIVRSDPLNTVLAATVDPQQNRITIRPGQPYLNLTLSLSLVTLLRSGSYREYTTVEVETMFQNAYKYIKDISRTLGGLELCRDDMTENMHNAEIPELIIWNILVLIELFPPLLEAPQNA